MKIIKEGKDYSHVRVSVHSDIHILDSRRQAVFKNPTMQNTFFFKYILSNERKAYFLVDKQAQMKESTVTK